MIADLQPELGLAGAPDADAPAADIGESPQRCPTGTAKKMRASKPAVAHRAIPERFADWKLTPGGRYCLQRLYIIIAAFHRGMARGEPKPSKRLVWETLRFRLDDVRRKLSAHGHELKREGGFWLNDNFTALAFDHVKSRRPEFAFFEDREHEQGPMEKSVVGGQ